MDSKRAIVFSSQTIYTEGIVSRLRQSPLSGETHYIAADAPDYLDQVLAIHPAIVIIDAIEDGDADCCLMCELLNAFSELTIIRLKVQEQDVQVISSSAHCVDNAQNLIDLIGSK